MEEDRIMQGGRSLKKTYAGIDYFRLAAAFMVIGIHIGPFSVWNEDLDYLVTYCAGRAAVPFFLMTTGYFVLAPCVKSGFKKKQAVYKYLVKNGVLYLSATLFYAPLALYSGNVPHSLPELVRAVLFDGTFYHLWYFPAAMIGVMILMFLARKSVRMMFLFSAGAYIAGLLGDSYYGLTEQIPLLRLIYSGIFSVSSYTRNGIFFAPVFLLLGMLSAFPDLQCSVRTCLAGLTVTFTGMLAEGYVTYSLDLQRHNSMYLLLLPVMYFLFQLLLRIPGRVPVWIRSGSMLLYILHPAVIVLLRGFAKITGLEKILTENTFVQYLSVCVLSLVFLPGIGFCMKRGKQYVSERTGLD